MTIEELARKMHSCSENLYHDPRCDQEAARRLRKEIRELIHATKATPADFFHAVLAESGFIMHNSGDGTKKLVDNLLEVWDNA